MYLRTSDRSTGAVGAALSGALSGKSRRLSVNRKLWYDLRC